MSRRPAEVGAGAEPGTEAGEAQTEQASLQLPLEERAAASPEAGPAGDAEAPEQARVEPPPPARPVDPKAQQAEYRRRVQTNASDVQARRQLAHLLAAQGEHAAALEQYEAARELAPEDPTLVLDYSETLIALKRFEPAERELRRLVKFQPANGAAYLQLGIASFRRGLYAQAEQDLERATELLPNVASAFFYRGEALNQLSRLDEAMQMLERTVELEPGNSRAYYLMGILYDKKNLPQEAALLYRKARQVAAR